MDSKHLGRFRRLLRDTSASVSYANEKVFQARKRILDAQAALQVLSRSMSDGPVKEALLKQMDELHKEAFRLESEFWGVMSKMNELAELVGVKKSDG
jgi:hypothetical protein